MSEGEVAKPAEPMPVPEPGETADKQVERWGKVKLAEHLRLAGDNQKLLDRTSRREDRKAEFDARVREAMLQQSLGEAYVPPEPTETPGGDPMEIRIDSPSTTIYQLPGGQQAQAAPQPVQQAPAAASSSPVVEAAKKLSPLAKLAIGAGLALGGGGLGSVATYLLTKQPPAAAVKLEDWGLRSPVSYPQPVVPTAQP